MSRFVTTMSLALVLGVATLGLAACDSGDPAQSSNSAQPPATATAPTAGSTGDTASQPGQAPTGSSQAMPETGSTPSSSGSDMNGGAEEPASP